MGICAGEAIEVVYVERAAGGEKFLRIHRRSYRGRIYRVSSMSIPDADTGGRLWGYVQARL